VRNEGHQFSGTKYPAREYDRPNTGVRIVQPLTNQQSGGGFITNGVSTTEEPDMTPVERESEIANDVGRKDEINSKKPENPGYANVWMSQSRSPLSSNTTVRSIEGAMDHVEGPPKVVTGGARWKQATSKSSQRSRKQ